MIDFILHELRRQGAVVTDEMGTAAMVAAHEAYGGERVYVPRLPKLQNAARIAQVAREGVRTNAEIALVTGLSLRHVKAIRRR